MSIREEDQDSESQSPSETEEDEEEESIEEEDTEPLPTVRPYAALMRSLAADSTPQAKRRKLNHSPEPKAAEENGEDGFEDEQGAEDTDHVEELEEGPETATDGLVEEVDELEDASDPFEAHFADPDENILSQRLRAVRQNQWATQKTVLPKVGKALIHIPQMGDLKSVAEPIAVSGPGELKLKQKLAVIMSKQRPVFDALEKSMAPLMFNYRDILYCERSTINSESLRRLTCLHVINHVFKSVSAQMSFERPLTELGLEIVLSRIMPDSQKRRIMKI
jgi:U3 small nucleolar RNA-associated protein 25